MGSQQVFYWTGQAREAGSRTYYERFSLNKAAFSVGDCVYLFPEVDSLPPYIGRIVSAFVEKEVASEGQDPHCIEVRRRPRARGVAAGAALGGGAHAHCPLVRPRCR